MKYLAVLGWVLLWLFVVSGVLLLEWAIWGYAIWGAESTLPFGGRLFTSSLTLLVHAGVVLLIMKFPRD